MEPGIPNFRLELFELSLLIQYTLEVCLVVHGVLGPILYEA